MYLPDLSPYYELDDVVCVGWLSSEHPYTQGSTPDSVIQKLKQLLLDKRDCHKTRGFHACPFCPTDGLQWREVSGKKVPLAKPIWIREGDKKAFLGSSQLWIPDGSGMIYAAPTLIYHYIIEHQYRPPQVYLDAVEAFDLASDWDAEGESLKRLNPRGYERYIKKRRNP